MNPDNASWFNPFNISELTTPSDQSNNLNAPLVFEIVSAYGTVGLSTGVPYASACPLVCNT